MSLKKTALAIAISLGTITFAATPPATMSYQALLRTPGGGPMSGTFDMVITLYSASIGGVQILVDSHTAGGGSAVTVEDGLLTVALGSGSVSDGSGAGTYTRGSGRLFAGEARVALGSTYRLVTNPDIGHSSREGSGVHGRRHWFDSCTRHVSLRCDHENHHHARPRRAPGAAPGNCPGQR